MIANQNQTGHLHDKGTDRLLAAVAEARYDTRAAAHFALATLPNLYAVEITDNERTVYGLGGERAITQQSWTVSAIHCHIKANAHQETRGTLHEAVCAVLDSYRKNPLGTDAFEDLERESPTLPATRAKLESTMGSAIDRRNAPPSLPGVWHGRNAGHPIVSMHAADWWKWIEEVESLRAAAPVMLLALQKIAALKHADRTCSLEAQGFSEIGIAEIVQRDRCADIALAALTKASPTT